MSDRWFDDIPEHDPDDPEAVARALRRRERASGRGSDKARRAKTPKSSSSTGDGPGLSSGRGSRRYGRFALIAGGAAACLLVVFLFFSIFQPFAGDGEGEAFNVNVPSGGVAEVGDLLADRGIIANSTFFQVNATVTGKRDQIYRGNHSFRKNMSYSAALDELGKQPAKVTVTVVQREGLSRSEMADSAEAAGVPGDYLADSVKSPDLDPDDYGADGNAENLEGFLFPATYELKPGSDAQELIDQQLQAFKDNIAGVNMKYARKKNLTTYDVLTIASMIDREVAVARERPLVAAVIYNRLSQGEPLGIDATIRFALDNWTEPLTESDLAVDSPYNTRLNQGLPPGPIGSPGLASIEAAARPANVDYLFYVVKPGTCNEHAFSTTLEQFNQDAATYQQALEEKGSSPTTCP